MKHLFRERSTKGFPELPLLAATQRHGVILKSSYETRTVTAEKDLHLLKLVEPGDFVISLRSFEGGIEVSHERGIISPAYTVLTPVNADFGLYARYLLKSALFVSGLRLAVTGIREGQNIDYSVLGETHLPVPPDEELGSIVRFISHTNQRIDRFVESKRKLIALLEEQKQAIVNQIVTRGLDPSTQLKPSGVPWLGHIPAHWQLTRTKYLFREVDHRSETGSEEQLSVSHLTGVTPRSQKNVTMFKAASYVGHKVCQPGDLVINTMWAWMAALGVAFEVGIVSPAYGVYRPLKTNVLNPAFADYMFRAEAYRRNYLAHSTGVRASRLRLYPDKFLALCVALPGLEEQEAIVDEIAVRTSKARQAIKQATREVKLIEEYRKRLISDVVTGQLDVCGAEIPDARDGDATLDEFLGERVSEFEEELEFAEAEA